MKTFILIVEKQGSSTQAFKCQATSAVDAYYVFDQSPAPRAEEAVKTAIYTYNQARREFGASLIDNAKEI